jgi:hypothetical protein
LPTPANSFNQNSTTAGLQNWDGTATPSTTALTQYNILAGASTNTVQNIAPGSNVGYVLTSGGATSYPGFQPIPFTQLPWTDEGTTFSALSGNGYFVTATATGNLPASPSQGNIISFAVDSASGILTVQSATGQFIRIGNVISATAGKAVSNKQGDSLTLVYRASDTTWIAVESIGTWTVT